MSTHRLYLTTALVLSLSAGLAPAAFAQNTNQDAAPAANDPPTEIVVTGQRASRRSRLDTLAPVDVVTAQSLQAQGSTELAQGLSRVAPSLNFPRPAGVDGTDNVRPASLRGLSPDQTLVLVDGKRRHTRPAAVPRPSISTPFRKSPSIASKSCVMAPPRNMAPMPLPASSTCICVKPIMAVALPSPMANTTPMSIPPIPRATPRMAAPPTSPAGSACHSALMVS
jgi:hypothetical protein